MKLIRFTTIVATIVSFIAIGSASADVTTGYISITNLSQMGDHQYLLNVYPAPTGHGCTNANPLVLHTTNSPYPSFDSMAPILMAAFLYNKPVAFQLHGCDTVSNHYSPVIVAVFVNQ